MFTELDPATEHDLRVFVKNTTDGREFLHAPVVSAKTRDGVPSSPVNLTAIQSGRGMILAWGWPALTKGDIQVFVIKVFQGGDQRQELDKLVTARDQDKKRVEFIVHGLEENVQAIPVQLNDLMNNILQRRHSSAQCVGNALGIKQLYPAIWICTVE